jgi:hypothetical protein
MWITGDIFAIIATLYKDVSVALLIIGIYRFIIDIVLTVQVLYYRIKNNGDASANGYILDDFPLTETDFRNTTRRKIFRSEIVSLVGCVTFTFLLYIFFVKYASNILGDVFAWSATVIFITSRIPQILLNHKRKSVVGLSFNTFKMIIFSNILYISGLLLPMYYPGRLNYFVNNLQWIIGSSIGLGFDFVIIYQFLKWRTVQYEPIARR